MLQSHPVPVQSECVHRRGFYSNPVPCQTLRQGNGICPELLQPLMGAPTSYQTYPEAAGIRAVKKNSY